MRGVLLGRVALFVIDVQFYGVLSFVYFENLFQKSVLLFCNSSFNFKSSF